MNAVERQIRAHLRAAAKYPEGHTRRANHLKAAEQYGGPKVKPVTAQILVQPPLPESSADGQAGKIARKWAREFYNLQIGVKT
jgi:hypothetical protein